MSFGLITRRVLTVNREDIVTRQESFELESPFIDGATKNKT